MLEQPEIQSYQGICLNNLKCKVIRVYVGTAWNTKLSGYMFEQLETLRYQGICLNSLKYKVIRVYIGTA